MTSPTHREKKEGKRIAPWNDPNVRWVCEEHPTEDQGHLIPVFPLSLWFGKKECGGAGMPEPTEENRLKGYLE